MNYIVAVSGGVDSVVLLDILSKTDNRLTVAHFDHGIRVDSADDARFVEALAEQYGLEFVGARVELGVDASEEQAREERYRFLYAEASKRNAVIVTAQHVDDLVETVALNLERGTGWRGLAIMSRLGIWRPFIVLSKASIYEYAMRHHLEWVEDSTNRSVAYARNSLRYRLHGSAVRNIRDDILKMWAHQLKLRRDIDEEERSLITKNNQSRHFLTQIDENLALELLGSAIELAGGVRPTRPRLRLALHAVKTARAGALHQIGDGISLKFSARNYTVTVV